MNTYSTKKYLIVFVPALVLASGIFKPLYRSLFPELEAIDLKFLYKITQLFVLVVIVLLLRLWPLLGLWSPSKIEPSLKFHSSLKYVSPSKIKTFEKLRSYLLLLPVFLLSMVPLAGIKELNDSHEFLIILLISLIIGCIEEIEYRGLLKIGFSIFSKKTFIWGSSTIFGLAHFLNLIYGADIIDTLVQVVFAFCFGLIFSVFYYKNGHLLPLIILHAIWDFNISLAVQPMKEPLDTIHTISLLLLVLYGLSVGIRESQKKAAAS